MAVEYNEEQFLAGLRGFAVGNASPYFKLASAADGVQHTDMVPIALGIAPALFWYPQYSEARKYLDTSLQNGATNMHGMIMGLLSVARNLGSAEEANSISVQTPSDIHAPSPSDVNGMLLEVATSATATFGLVPVGFMALIHTFVLGTDMATATMAWTAVAALGVWLLCLPIDPEWSKAMGYWDGILQNLDQFEEALVEPQRKIEAGWQNSEGGAAFGSWLERFGQEVADAKTACGDTKATLQEWIDAINDLEFVLLGSAVLNLVVVIAVEIFGWTFPPVTEPIAKAIESAIGITMTVEKVSAMGVWILMSGLAVKAIWGLHTKSFIEENKPASDGSTIDFDDVAEQFPVEYMVNNADVTE